MVKTGRKKTKKGKDWWYVHTKLQNGKIIWGFRESSYGDHLQEKYHFIAFTEKDPIWVYKEKDGIYEDKGKEKIQALTKAELGEEYNTGRVNEVVNYIKYGSYKDREKIEPPENLQNLKNGVLNVDTLELKPHTHEYFFTGALPVAYDPKAESPVFDVFLKKAVNNKGVETLQEYLGYTLQRNSVYKKALFLYGPTDTRKTTFLNVVLALIGPKNTASVSLQRMEDRFQISRLYHKLANIYPDLTPTALTKTGVFKYTTGNDPIEAEIKHIMRKIQFTNYAKHYYSGNQLPEAPVDESNAFYNRLLMVPFTNVVKEKEKDPNFLDKITTTEELSGILNWALRGLTRLNKQGIFTHDESPEFWEEHYKRAASPVFCFVMDMCVVEIDAVTTKQDSYNSFVEYCLEQNISPTSRNNFYDRLQRYCPGILGKREKVEGLGTPHIWKHLKIIGAEKKTKPKKGQTQLEIPVLPVLPRSPIYSSPDLPSNSTISPSEPGEQYIEKRGKTGKSGIPEPSQEDETLCESEAPAIIQKAEAQIEQERREEKLTRIRSSIKSYLDSHTWMTLDDIPAEMFSRLVREAGGKGMNLQLLRKELRSPS